MRAPEGAPRPEDDLAYTLGLKAPAYSYLDADAHDPPHRRFTRVTLTGLHKETTLRDLCKRIYGGAGRGGFEWGWECFDLTPPPLPTQDISFFRPAHARAFYEGVKQRGLVVQGCALGIEVARLNRGLGGEGVGEGLSASEARNVDWDVDVDSDVGYDYEYDHTLAQDADVRPPAADVDSVTDADPDPDVHSDTNPEYTYTRVLRIDSTTNDPLSRLQLRADFEVFGRVEWVWVDLRHAHRTTALLAFAHARAALRAHTHIATLHPAYGAARLSFAPDPCARVPVGDDAVERRRDWPVGRGRGGGGWRTGRGWGEGRGRKRTREGGGGEGVRKTKEKEERVPRRAGWAREALLRLKYAANKGEAGAESTLRETYKHPSTDRRSRHLHNNTQYHS
ncbi:hypothetical protein B0H13DRAFT_1936588 [Mycena leptocephala]|nr:hypothetical protein B0H13DRAFT_1936588 [Mycena leptocephala]